MSIHITINGDNAAEALRELKIFAAGLTPPAVDARPAPVAVNDRLVAEEVPAGEEKAFPDAKPARKPRAAKQAETPQEIEAVADAQEEQAPPLADTSASAAEATAESAPPSSGEASSSSATTADEKPFTADDARRALADLLAQQNGKDMAKAVFAEFDAAKLSDITEANYKPFIAAIAKKRGL